MKQLEQDLKLANEVSIRLQKELDDANQKLQAEETKTTKKKAPKLGSIGKFPSADGVSWFKRSNSFLILFYRKCLANPSLEEVVRTIRLNS